MNALLLALLAASYLHNFVQVNSNGRRGCSSRSYIGYVISLAATAYFHPEPAPNG